MERVKWYAPHIRHVVLDIEIRPPGRNFNEPSQQAAATAATSGKARKPRGGAVPRATGAATALSPPLSPGGSGACAAHREGSPASATAAAVPWGPGMLGTACSSGSSGSSYWFRRPVSELPAVEVVWGVTEQVREGQGATAATAEPSCLLCCCTVCRMQGMHACTVCRMHACSVCRMHGTHARM